MQREVASPIVSNGRSSSFYTVRDLRSDDGRLLAAATLGNVNWSGPRFTAEQVERNRRLAGYFTPRSADQEFGAVAEDAASPVAVAWARFFTRGEPGYGFVDEAIPELSVWVTEKYRGHGIGTSLMENVIDRARSRELPGVSLSVEAANPARRMYERLGFAPAGGETTLVLRF